MSLLNHGRMQYLRLFEYRSRTRSRLNNISKLTFDRYFSKMKALVLGVYTKKSDCGNEISDVTESFKEIDGKSDGKLSTVLHATGPFCKSIRHKLFWMSTITEKKIDFDCVSIVDLGSKDVKENPLEGIDEKAENVRCAIANGVNVLRSNADFEEIYVDPCDYPKCAAEASNLALYSFDEQKNKESCRPKSNVRLFQHPGMSEESVAGFETGVHLAECQNFARSLMNTPANLMTPTIFAETVENKLKDSGVKVIIREEAWIQSQNMGSFLSVTRGSEEKPKFVELHYEGASKNEKCIALVGKGITFDSGGISLKPCKDMDLMRADMGGGASVTASILGASLLKLKVNVKGFIPLCENLPSGKATKPGDVVRAMNGKTIQVDNTDAEGRLILADGLCYAQKFEPLVVLDVATLTGAICIALGCIASGVYSNDDDMWKLMNRAGWITGDRVWRMPLYDFYKQAVKQAPCADLNNVSNLGGDAGSCTAAGFLSEFIEPGKKWMHLDIAASGSGKDRTPYCAKGFTGRPTRTLVQFFQQLEGEFNPKESSIKL